MSSGIIYFIMNIVTGECYIGQTWVSLEKRWKQHCYSSSRCIHLRNAIQKYGKDKFVRSVLTKDLTTQEDMNTAEIYWIGYYNSIENGYNLTKGGEGGIPSDEVRANMSVSRKGKRTGDKNPFFGKHHTNKTKADLRAIQTGKKHSDECRAQNSDCRKGKKNHMYGKHHTDDAKAKISAAKTGENHPNWGKTGDKHPMYGKRHSDKTKAEMSAARTGNKNPMFGKKLSPETIAKREATKKAKRELKEIKT